MATPLVDMSALQAEPAEERNCPFYGRFLTFSWRPADAPFALIDQDGNQCALVRTSFSPCYLELDGLAVDWRDCTRVAATRRLA